MSRTRELLALARFRTPGLRKGRQNVILTLRKSAPVTQPKMQAAMTSAQPGNYVRVQRPGMHAAPTLARCVGAGKHGITCMGEGGQPFRVRHEHVLESHAAPTGGERATFARALAAQGIPISLDERYLKQDASGFAARRPTMSQLGLLEVLTEHGVPLDLDGIRESATYADVQELLRRYVNDPAGRLTS